MINRLPNQLDQFNSIDSAAASDLEDSGNTVKQRLTSGMFSFKMRELQRVPIEVDLLVSVAQRAGKHDLDSGRNVLVPDEKAVYSWSCRLVVPMIQIDRCPRQ